MALIPLEVAVREAEADCATCTVDRVVPAVSIVVVSYNTAAVLRDCLQAIRAAGGGVVAETIVVDNGSCDGSAALVRSAFPEVRLIANHENVGFGRASNQGVAAARAPYILLLNSDALLHPTTLDPLLAILEAEPLVGLVGPRLIGTDGRVQRTAYRFPRPLVLLAEQLGLGRYLPVGRPCPAPERGARAGSLSTPWLLGACLLAPRDLLALLGPFDPRFFMYAEDIDLCHRVRLAGQDIRLVPGAVALHLGGASSRRERSRMALLSTASMYLFYRKHYGRAALAVALLIFRGVALIKLARDIGRGLLHPWRSLEERRVLAEDRHIWRQVLRLRPPQLPARPRGGADDRA